MGDNFCNPVFGEMGVFRGNIRRTVLSLLRGFGCMKPEPCQKNFLIPYCDFKAAVDGDRQFQKIDRCGAQVLYQIRIRCNSIALKIKEISYIHAEGMMGGELKHGTIALIEDGTPVVSLVSNHDPDIISNAREVEARGAKIYTITNNRGMGGKSDVIHIETGNDGKFGILAAVAGQLIAYYAADALGRPIDKPRNLAKSVTVK